MNVIASLIPIDAEKAEQVVEDLSELFRASLQEAGSFVRVSEELDLCRRYINIETLRLGDRLKVSWDVETPPIEAEMPLLLIQPLIENAVYHGIQPLIEGGIIHVNLVFNEGQMVLTITNPLKGPDKAADEAASKNYSPKPPAKGNSIAIDNIRRRLEVVYGENATLITKQQGNHFKTTLCCPTVPKFL
jgi:two-component system sensor histidine kinase AlgZ